MHVALNEFNKEQRLWYANLIIAAIKADGNVNPEEMGHLLLAMHFLCKEEVDGLQSILHLNVRMPGIEQVPAGLSLGVLADVYTELVRVVVSDGKLTPKEHAFLNEARGWFKLPDDVAQEMDIWTDTSLKMEQHRRQIVGTLK